MHVRFYNDICSISIFNKSSIRVLSKQDQHICKKAFLLTSFEYMETQTNVEVTNSSNYI